LVFGVWCLVGESWWFLVVFEVVFEVARIIHLFHNHDLDIRNTHVFRTADWPLTWRNVMDDWAHTTTWRNNGEQEAKPTPLLAQYRGPSLGRCATIRCWRTST
jgi:hypothetical protein